MRFKPSRADLARQAQCAYLGLSRDATDREILAEQIKRARVALLHADVLGDGDGVARQEYLIAGLVARMEAL